MRVVKGMVQVAGKTYRVVRLAQGSYEVVRILDDLRRYPDARHHGAGVAAGVRLLLGMPLYAPAT